MVEALKNHCHKTPSLCDLGTRCWCTFATKLDHLSATKQNWYLFANIEPGAPGCGKQPNNANICFILLTQIHIICFQTVGKPDALDLNQMVKYSQHLTFSWKIKVYLKLLLAHMNNDESQPHPNSSQQIGSMRKPKSCWLLHLWCASIFRFLVRLPCGK